MTGRWLHSLLVCLALVGLSHPPAAHARPLTDAEVLARLNAGRKMPLKQEHVCIRRADELPGVVIVGLFARNRGCALRRVLLRGKPYRPEQASRPVLRALGWKRADGAKRRALLLRWVQQVVFAFDNALEQAPKTFKHRFHKPVVSVLKGIFQVTLWSRVPAGMVCGARYRRVRLTFAADGRQVSRKVLARSFIPC